MIFPHDESIVFAALTSNGGTASNMNFIATNAWTLVTTTSAASLTGFTIQVNNNNPNAEGQGGMMTVMSAGMYGNQTLSSNPAFATSWVNWSGITGQASAYTAPFRFIRIVNPLSAQWNNVSFFLFKAFPLQNR